MINKFNIYNNYRIGGSIVHIMNVLDKYNRLGTTIDTGLIIPIFENEDKNHKINSIDLTISGFKPVLWKPVKYSWHPTYSIDINFNLIGFWNSKRYHMPNSN